MHFEDVWNEAELLSSKLEERTLDDIVKDLHDKVDKLSIYASLPKEQALNIGDILFELANAVSISEKRSGTGINVSAGLKVATETRKDDLLDPEISDKDDEKAENTEDNSDSASFY